TQVKGIIAASLEAKSPIILGTSEGESKFFGLEEAVALRNVLRKKTGLPIFLNLDHGKSFEYAKKAIDAGYDSVHFDGSKLPLEENIKITREVVKYCSASWRRRGTLVEGEVGRIGTDSSKIYNEKFEIKEEDLTKPEEAKKYLDETGVDLLAVSCGNFHGIEISGIDPHLRLDVLEKIKKVAGKTFLVLHGGSGTPQDDIRGAIKLGIVKININTELRLAFSESLRRALATLPDEIIPYRYLPKAMESVKIAVEEKIKLFESRNKI
ncbi:MAG: class II fructose-bisphosphate aldolase, partial [Patescibacteria group bacterium]